MSAAPALGALLPFVRVEQLAFAGLRGDEASAYLADSDLSFQACGPPFFTCVSQAPAVHAPDALWLPEAQRPERHGGA